MIWFALFAALQVADILTTHLILKRGGTELNPLLAFFFKKANPLAVMIATKAALLVGLYLSGSEIAAQVLCVIYFAVVMNNLKSIVKK